MWKLWAETPAGSLQRAALSRAEDCPGPDLIYLPEVTFDYDRFLEQVKAVKKKKTSVVIAVSEGIKLANGEYVCEDNKQADIRGFLSVINHLREPLYIWRILLAPT